MPYPNEYACRLLPKENIITCRSMDRESATYGKKYRAIICQFRDVKLGASKWYIQSLRFDKENWTEGQARTLCSRYEGDFEGLAKSEVEETRKMDLSFMSQVRKRDVIRLEDGSGILVREYPLILQGKGSELKGKFDSLEVITHPEGKKFEFVDEDWDGMKVRASFDLESEIEKLAKGCVIVLHLGSETRPKSHFAYIGLHHRKDGKVNLSALRHNFGVIALARGGWGDVNKIAPEKGYKGAWRHCAKHAFNSKKIKFSDDRPLELGISQSEIDKYKWWKAEE